MMATTSKQLDSQLIISKLLAELGEPWLPVHKQALEAVEAGDAETLRLLSATNLDDSFCRACGYMASIPKLPPTVAILIAESLVRSRTLKEKDLYTDSIQWLWIFYERNKSAIYF